MVFRDGSPLLVLACLVLSPTSHASAMCAGPSAFLAPSRGTLPPNPSVWVFTVMRLPTIHSVTPMIAGPEESFGDVTVQRLDFAIAEGSLVVELGDDRYEYAIDPGWERGERAPEVRGWTRTEHHWTCSYTDAEAIAVQSSAAVFEVSWPGRRVLLPGATELLVGHVSCLGFTHPDRETRIHDDEATVTALYPDGTQRSAVARRDPAPKRAVWKSLGTASFPALPVAAFAVPALLTLLGARRARGYAVPSSG